MANKKIIRKIRKILVDEVKNAEVHSVKLSDLDYEEDFIEEIVFDEYIKRGEKGGKVFAKELKKVLDRFDFSGISFDNFRCIDFNFKGLYGIEIDPQKVYKLNLYGATLSEVKFIGSFAGVYINKANFRGSKGAKIDPNFLKADDIHDVVFTDVEFTSPFFQSNGFDYSGYIKGCDFTGSHNAVINCNIYYLGLYDNKFSGVRFIGTIKQANVAGSNFSGAIDAVIDAEKIISIANSILKDVNFINEFDNAFLEGADFTGSKGAVINIQNFYGKKLKNTVLNDVSIKGSLDGVKLSKKQLEQLNYIGYKENINNIEEDFKIKVSKITNRNYIKK